MRRENRTPTEPDVAVASALADRTFIGMTEAFVFGAAEFEAAKIEQSVEAEAFNQEAEDEHARNDSTV
jgi:hypothetical protein